MMLGSATRQTEGPIVYRLARDEDLLRTREIFLVTADALNRQHGISSPPSAGAAHERSMTFRRHSRRYDPERYWVAEAGGVVVGYGVATQRGRVWYLASLYVLPEFQGRGIGSELLDRCLAAGAPGSVCTVISEAMQPISNALYMRRGMVPQESLLVFTGPTMGAPPPTTLRLESFPTSGPGPGVLDAIDVDVIGFTRQEEHELWSGAPDLHGYLIRRGGDDVGYLYVSESGAIGPAAVREVGDLGPTVELAIAQVRELGATEVRVRLAGAARDAIAAVVRRNFRLGESMTLFLSSEPLGAWDRYISSGSDTYF